MGTFIRHAMVAVTAIREFIEFCNSLRQTREALKRKTIPIGKSDMTILKQQIALLEKRADLQDRITDHLSNSVLPSLERVIKVHDNAIDEMGSLAITNERMVIRMWKKLFPQSKTKKIARTERRPSQLIATPSMPSFIKKRIGNSKRT